MTTIAALLLATSLAQDAPAPAPAAPPPPDTQIAGAVMAAPADRRGDATVLGYDAGGTLVTLRKGSNDLVCLADNPKDAGFNVACYHKDLEPFMARGRELIAQGVKGTEREEIRWKEIDAGKLPMPKEPRSLCIVTGSGFDPATGDVAGSYTRWVIYTPFATAESTGLSTTPIPGGPWLMFPGKANAHIMISPPKPKS